MPWGESKGHAEPLDHVSGKPALLPQGPGSGSGSGGPRRPLTGCPPPGQLPHIPRGPIFQARRLAAVRSTSAQKSACPPARPPRPSACPATGRAQGSPATSSPEGHPQHPGPRSPRGHLARGVDPPEISQILVILRHDNARLLSRTRPPGPSPSISFSLSLSRNLPARGLLGVPLTWPPCPDLPTSGSCCPSPSWA